MLTIDDLAFFDKLSAVTDGVSYSASEAGTKSAPSRWNDVIVQTLHGPLTKQDVFNYYSMPTVREGILSQIRNNPSIVYQHFSPHEPVLKRWEQGEPIHIKSDSGEVEDPHDYQYWIERRAIEFHPVLGDTTKTVWVDLDPGKNFDWDKTKQVAYDVKQRLHQHPDVHETNIRFSGGRGFYVIGELAKEIPTMQAKQLVQDQIRDMTTADKSLTLGFARPDQLRLDTSTLKPTGSIRGVYSLNKTTGLVSVPVEEEGLSSFSPEDATIHAVAGRRPPHTKPIRL